MSKIAEQKALEAYPIDIIPDDDTMGFTSSDRNEVIRLGYIKGYDQTFEDFMEKSERFFNEELFTRFNGAEYRVASNKCMNLQQFIEQFKNYMQNDTEI